MNKYILFIIFIIILIIFYFLNKFIKINNKIEYFNKEKFSNFDDYMILENNLKYDSNIIFLDKNDLYNILSNDKDNYYKSFYPIDFYVRKIKNIEEYLNYIKKSISSPNNIEKNKITKCINNANKKLKYINKSWFNGEKCIKLQWKIGMVTGKLYENGLPHTRDDIIIISKEDINLYTEKKLTKTLIHEKIHIYQKMYPNDINIYLNINNLKKYKKKTENDNIRANPDLDSWIYIDNNNNVYKAVYNKNPQSVEDIEYFPYNSQSSEHPFEKMAIEIENL